jgi:hypothetical protein
MTEEQIKKLYVIKEIMEKKTPSFATKIQAIEAIKSMCRRNSPMLYDLNDTGRPLRNFMIWHHTPPGYSFWRDLNGAD